MKKVSIWTRTQKDPEKPTMPHNTAAKKHHHLCDRPKEVSGLKTPMHYEGDTVVSVCGDTTAVLSVLERMSNYQFFVKMGRNTQQCLHGALKRIVNAGAGIRTITRDNGIESGNVERIEKILKSAPSAYKNAPSTPMPTQATKEQKTRKTTPSSAASWGMENWPATRKVKSCI